MPDHSAVGFKIKNMWGLINVKGQFTDFNGDGQITGKGRGLRPPRYPRRVAAAPVSASRDEHLRSADFFDVERFPEISVVVTAVSRHRQAPPICAPSFTIKGVTAAAAAARAITELDDGSVQIAAETKVDRAQFGLGWNKFGMIGARRRQRPAVLRAGARSRLAQARRRRTRSTHLTVSASTEPCGSSCTATTPRPANR